MRILVAILTVAINLGCSEDISIQNLCSKSCTCEDFQDDEDCPSSCEGHLTEWEQDAVESCCKEAFQTVLRCEIENHTCEGFFGNDTECEPEAEALDACRNARRRCTSTGEPILVVLSEAEVGNLLEQLMVTTRGLVVFANVAELTSQISLPTTPEQAYAEVSQYLDSALPCASSTNVSAGPSGSRLQIEYRAPCDLRGQNLTGRQMLQVQPNHGPSPDPNEDLHISQTLESLSEGRFTLDGVGQVFAGANLRESNGFAREAPGRVVDILSLEVADEAGRFPTVGRALVETSTDSAGGIGFVGSLGIPIDPGWSVSPSGIHIRWSDAVPRTGVYTVTTSQDPDYELRITFATIDGETSRATIDGSLSTSFLLHPITGRLK